MLPPDLRSLILYDNFEWKTAQKSHENLRNICDLKKIPAISLEKFEREFYGILKENYYRKPNFRYLAKIDNLKLCIISDVLAGKSIEKSYKDMSEVFGAKNIDDLNFFFNYRFYHVCYALDHDQKLDPKFLEFLNLPIEIHHKILENLDVKNRNLAKIDILKVCILSDVFAGKSIEKSYKDISETFGAENIDFLDFDFWFYRFYHGSYDLDHDRKLDPEPLEFLSLPMLIHHKIIDNLDVKNRMNVRKVSKSLRDVIDSQKIVYSFISIYIGVTWMRLKLIDFVIDYSESSYDILPPAWARTNPENIKISDKNFRKMALNDLENVLKSAKTVEYFQVVFDRSSSRNQFESLLKVMENTKFDVKRISISEDRKGEALQILSLFKPGKLEQIGLSSFRRNGILNELVEMDQFKMAREIHISNYGILDFSLIDRFFHFDEISLYMKEIKRENVVFLQNALEKLPNDRVWKFYSDNLDRIEVEQAIDQSRVIEYHENDARIYYKTKIPNSEYFISFYICFYGLLTMTKYK